MKAAIGILAASLAAVSPIAAQDAPPARTLSAADRAASPWFGKVNPKPTNTWASAWVGGYLDPGRVRDVAGVWTFGSALGAGAGIHRQIGQGLVIGLDGSYTSADYKTTDDANQVVQRGDARLMTALVSGRLRYGGGGNLGMYLTGGAGTIVYELSEDDGRDMDLALLTGAGLEYKMSQRYAAFLEWGRFWTFHQNEDVGSNTTKHSQLRLGGRFGW